jgi:hypothetical protein
MLFKSCIEGCSWLEYRDPRSWGSFRPAGIARTAAGVEIIPRAAAAMAAASASAYGANKPAHFQQLSNATSALFHKRVNRHRTGSLGATSAVHRP